MKANKFTETNLKDSSSWFETETWNESSAWQTDFHTEESLWQSPATEGISVRSSTSKIPTLSSTNHSEANLSDSHLPPDTQLVEVVKGELLLTDANPSINEPIQTKENLDSFEIDDQTSLQVLHSELAKELNDSFFDDLPLDSDDLGQPPHSKNLALDSAEGEKGLGESTPENKLSVEKVLTKTSGVNLSSDLQVKEKDSEETITLNVPIRLAPIVRELVDLFEKTPSTTLQSPTFKNTFKHNKL